MTYKLRDYFRVYYISILARLYFANFLLILCPDLITSYNNSTIKNNNNIDFLKLLCSINS